MIYVVTCRYGKTFDVEGASLSDAKRKAVDHARANGLSRDLVKIEPKRDHEPCGACNRHGQCIRAARCLGVT